MKTTTHPTPIWKKLLIPALMLAGCQQAPETKNTTYADQAQKSVQSIANRLSNAYKKRMAVGQGSTRSVVGASPTNGGTGFGTSGFGGGSNNMGFNNWNPFGGVPYDDGYYLRAQTETSIRKCIALVRAVPPEAENYEFMIATLARCMNTAIQHRNPMMTAGYRNMYQNDQTAWRYGMDAGRPGSMGYYGGGYPQYHGYGTQGWIPDDLQFFPK